MTAASSPANWAAKIAFMSAQPTSRPPRRCGAGEGSALPRPAADGPSPRGEVARSRRPANEHPGPLTSTRCFLPQPPHAVVTHISLVAPSAASRNAGLDDIQRSGFSLREPRANLRRVGGSAVSARRSDLNLSDERLSLCCFRRRRRWSPRRTRCSTDLLDEGRAFRGEQNGSPLRAAEPHCFPLRRSASH